MGAKHLYCAFNNVGRGSFYHRKEIISTLWPGDAYVWHPWNERRLRSVCDCNWNTWAGPGGSAKTVDAAVFGIEFWLECPEATAVIVCSTTMKMLRKRIWSQVASYHQRLPKALKVGELIDSDTMIRWKKGDARNGIFGMAVEEGPIDEVLNNLIGIHTHRVFLILDEMQGVREAILAATRNMAKNPVFKFLGIGNPESILDPLGRVSEPINGWDSVERAQTETWEIHPGPALGKGRCDFFDGRKSPACLDPEFAKRNPWMINQQQIDQDLQAARGNENDARYWSQTIGWWPPMGLDNTVLDEAIITKFKCREKAIWTHGFRKFACLDPSFEGGDERVLHIGRFGEVEEQPVEQEGVWNVAPKSTKRWVIGFDEKVPVPVDSNSDTPIHYQIVNRCVEVCRARGITPEFFALDSSGEGGGTRDIFAATWGVVYGVEFGGRPSDRPTNDGTGRTCRDIYDRKSSELNIEVRNFAMSDGIRGLSEAACGQFCARRTEFKNGKYRVEKKADMKKRTGRSPDDADSIAVGVELCRQHGAFALLGGTAVVDQDLSRIAAETEGEFSEENYTVEPTFDWLYELESGRNP